MTRGLRVRVRSAHSRRMTRPDAGSPRRLRPDEARVAVETLRDAFLRDPLFCWLLPDDELRAGWLEWFHAMSLAQSFAAEGAWTLDSGPRAAAMATIPPGAWPISLGAMIRSIPLPRRRPTLRLVGGGLRLLGRMSALHPTEPHVYLAVIGVAPDRKGQGLGGALLRHVCATADEADLPAYLETGNPENLPLYERFGFRVEHTVEEHRGPPLWTMRRPVRP